MIFCLEKKAIKALTKKRSGVRGPMMPNWFSCPSFSFILNRHHLLQKNKANGISYVVAGRRLYIVSFDKKPIYNYFFHLKKPKTHKKTSHI
jgi:hypothetical protein